MSTEMTCPLGDVCPFDSCRIEQRCNALPGVVLARCAEAEQRIDALENRLEQIEDALKRIDDALTGLRRAFNIRT